VTVVAGIDVGNATTEVVVGRVADGGVEVVAADRAPTRRTKGSQESAAYFELPNYVANFRRLGYGDADFAGGGSDALVDALVAWGDEEAIAGRVRAQLQAGADHVCIQVIDAAGDMPPRAAWRRLAPALVV
jgi:probable F420-dependent oxidoreductase